MGTAVAAPAHVARENVRLAVEALGANALAARVAPREENRTAPAEASPFREVPQAPLKVRSAGYRAVEIPMDAAETLDSLPRARVLRNAQPSLFGAELLPKIIPFETLLKTAIDAKESEPARAPAIAPALPKAATSKPAAAKAAPARAQVRKTLVDDSQATLDFLPPLKTAARTLKTNAEAVIFCDAPAAAPIHRATAAALDLSMILLAFGGMLITFQLVGRPATIDRATLLMLAGLLGVTAVFYSLLFAISGTVTPGMQWTGLRLINFDGFPVDGRGRALRLAGCWLSVLSGGLGILWSLLDEENLTWHDHISKSFPALRESDSVVGRHAGR